MKDFEVHDLTDGWVGQADSLAIAITIRDEILREQIGSEVKITATVDEDDLVAERCRGMCDTDGLPHRHSEVW